MDLAESCRYGIFVARLLPVPSGNTRRAALLPLFRSIAYSVSAAPPSLARDFGSVTAYLARHNHLFRIKNCAVIRTAESVVFTPRDHRRGTRRRENLRP